MKKLIALGFVFSLFAMLVVMPAKASEPQEAIAIKQINCGINNVFIVSQGDSAILVDTAGTSSRRRVLRACRKYDVKLIVLTHAHYDHAQNAAWLSEELGVPIAMHPADFPLLDDILHEPIQSTDFTSRALIAMLKLSRVPGFRWLGSIMAIEPFEFIELYDGFSFAEYGVDAEIIGLPGHTPGSVGVLTKCSLIAGDALTNLFGPGKAALYSDEQAMLESAAKASALGDIMVYFGHGKPLMNREW